MAEARETMPATREFRVDRLEVEIHLNARVLGEAAAAYAAEILRASIAARGLANLICATGMSQITFYAALSQVSGVDWQRVHMFHMDEYVGLSADHPASFRRYLREKLVDRVRPASFYGIDGGADDLDEECRRYAGLLAANSADLCCMGIGENGHLAFNDPPEARFDDPQPVKVVRLAQASRRQQVDEGFFETLAQVPERAITLTIPSLLAARQALVIVPEARKAQAVRAALQDPISPACPASVLRQQGHARLLLDRESGSLLNA
jgi:glucosamine-6-phosphate deaminase